MRTIPRGAIHDLAKFSPIAMGGLFLFAILAFSQEEKKSLPLTPEKQLAMFQLPADLRIELVASDPQIVDPVAMAFDEFGRLIVVEMRGYPNRGVATGNPAPGRIVRLEDPDAKGVYQKSTVIVEGLRVPNSVMPFDGGLLVSDAPSILYFKEINGKLDKKVLFTGFDLSNIQMLPNGLQWGLDNRVYSLGGNGGNISSPTEPKFAPVVLRGRGFRFDPKNLTTFQPTSGGGQFGLTCDDWGHWFTSTNSQHLRQIVLPDHYLARNPFLSTPQTTLDIPEHGAACKVFRISPFEAWRVERTSRRKDDPAMVKRLPPTELVPGGFITSACSPLIYRADLLPEAYRGNNFVCDPANNLIHREKLEPKGSTFVAKRTDADKEFLASTDNWFRPCCLTIGPEGAIYIADICREVIETPLSLPEDIQKRYDLNSRGTGRIWQIVPKDWKPTEQKFPGTMNLDELVAQLESKNSWRRTTAHRLLVERNATDAVPALKRLAEKSTFGPGRVHALWVLRAFDLLPDELLVQALKDTEGGVRQQALILAESRMKDSETIRKMAIRLAADPDPMVRFQAAFSLGELPASEAGSALATILARDSADPWTTSAALSSAKGDSFALLEALVKQCDTKAAFDARKVALGKLAGTASRVKGNSGAKLLGLAANLDEKFPGTGLNVILDGLRTSGFDLDAVWNAFEMQDATNHARIVKRFKGNASVLTETGRLDLETRLFLLPQMANAPSSFLLGLAPKLLTPQEPPEIQLATVRLLADRPTKATLDVLLTALPKLSFEPRKAAVDILLTRKDTIPRILDGIEKGTIPANLFDPTRIALLREYPDPAIRERAKTLFAASPTRAKVLEEYRKSLDLTGDSTRGKAIFKANCITCHRLEDQGVNLGADLTAALGNYTRENLLISILDPSREVDPRYLSYSLVTTDGRTLVGLLSAETATSVTLRQPEKQDTVVLRGEIESLKASAKSLMPEGLEMKITLQEMADLMGYLLDRGKKK